MLLVSVSTYCCLIVGREPFAVLDLVQRLVYIRLMDLAQGPDQFRRFSDELGWMGMRSKTAG